MGLINSSQSVRVGGALGCFTAAGPGTDPLRHNLGDSVGDQPNLVAVRRREIAEAIGHPIVWMHQTHSTHVHQVVPGDVEADEPIQADGVVASVDSIGPLAPALAVQVADCMPVLLASGDGRVIGAVHAGRRGFENGILANAVELMRSLGQHGELFAVIGPAICGRCYEVPAALRDQVSARFPDAFATTSWGTPSLDLPAGAVAQLEKLRVHVTNVGPCTFESAQHFSYRQDPGCGRQAGIIQSSDMINDSRFRHADS